MAKVWQEVGTQALTGGALAMTFTVPNQQMTLKKVLLKASVNITETVTVHVTPVKGGANYKTLLKTTSLSTEQNFTYDANDQPLEIGDIVTVGCTNGNTTGTVYATIYLEVRDGS